MSPPGCTAALAQGRAQTAGRGFLPGRRDRHREGPGYLALANVICIGGSWVAPREAVAAGDGPDIETLGGNSGSAQTFLARRLESC